MYFYFLSDRIIYSKLDLDKKKKKNYKTNKALYLIYELLMQFNSIQKKKNYLKKITGNNNKKKRNIHRFFFFF